MDHAADTLPVSVPPVYQPDRQAALAGDHRQPEENRGTDAKRPAHAAAAPSM